uniref:carbonic anhydrase n=1 Tax=Caligus rogercresseyi TaxID=217165 RepID=C1BPS8_CALRO|nr:Carbonic anhydrase 6 precursor [Caligus rogercresseyi]
MTSSINYLGTTLGLIALATLLSQVDAGGVIIDLDPIAVSSTAQAETPNKPYWDSFDVLKICNSGTEQSPIDIKEQFTESGPFSTISYDIYDTLLNFVMKNDGNTVKAYLKDTKDIPSIKFLGYQYEFSHFLFHWGGDNTVGSEHLLDGIAAPLEVQLVHFNSANERTFEEALAKKGNHPCPRGFVRHHSLFRNGL